jgi:cell division protein FtsN
VGSQELHRVRVGFFRDREEALAKAKELVSRGYVVLVVDAR